MSGSANNGRGTAAKAAATVAALLLGAAAAVAPAPATTQTPEIFEVRAAWFTAIGPGRFLNADLRAPESRPLRQALDGGLAIDFSLQVLVNRQRRWWLDQQVAEIDWRAALSYDSILRRYRLSTADGFRREYRNLRDALDRMGELRHWPVSPGIAPALEDPDAYVLARLQVDVDRLPQPVKILLLTDDEWDFDSGWTRLPLILRREADDRAPAPARAADGAGPGAADDSAAAADSSE